MSPVERTQLRMRWPWARIKHRFDPKIADGYSIRNYQAGDEEAFLALMAETDFDRWTQEKLDYNLSRVLPAGWFFAVEFPAQRIVGTAMCLHNYTGQNPFTGDLGWLACHPQHRGRGLGFALSALVTRRFCEAGYTQIQLHTEYYRLAAIKTYSRLGYVPVMYCREMYELWKHVCRQLGWPYKPQEWIEPGG
jgi:mycothiol synthase